MRLRCLLVSFAAIPACFNPESGGTATSETTSGTTSEGSDTGDPETGQQSTTGVDSSGGGESGGCAQDCNDGIDCTEDACVDGVCTNTPMDTLCDDGFDCTSEVCDAAMGCVATPDDTVCDDGIDCTTDSCDPARGCVAAPDDALCDDGVDCTADACDPVMGCSAAPDDALCNDGIDCTADSCDPVMGCVLVPDDAICDDGAACSVDVCDPMVGCTIEATNVLVFNGSNGETTGPEDAVSSFGYTPIVVTDELGFDAAYDAGGFVAIVWDVPSVFSTVPASTQMRLDSWVSGGGRLIFGYWNLDANPATATTLDVSVVASINSPEPIHPDPVSPVNLFDTLETITSPIVYTDNWSDNGDQLALAGPGFVAGRFSDPAGGPGAILVTHGERVVTNGFIISEITRLVVDADGDGTNDGVELLRNEIDLVCNAP